MKMNREIFIAIVFGSIVGVVISIVMQETGMKAAIRKVVAK
jgi:hypothetical protein